MIGIYKITNMINEKIYIGQSTDIERRWKTHRAKQNSKYCTQYNSPLYRAIRKYGIENFRFEIIEECLPELLNEREIYWISYFDSVNQKIGYNLTRGGYNGTSSILQESQVKEIINLLLNTKKTQTEIANIFNVSQRTVSGINLGQVWKYDNYSYPLRKTYTISKMINGERVLIRTKKCIDCGKEITSSATRCVPCNNKRQKSNIPDRSVLKKLIREKSFVQIGKDYGVSDVAVHKWCRKLDLPDKKKDIKNFSDFEWSKI